MSIYLGQAEIARWTSTRSHRQSVVHGKSRRDALQGPDELRPLLWPDQTIEFAFVRNHTRGAPLVVVTLMLVIFALDVPVLIMSGYSESDVMQRFTADPRIGFLPKPFTADALIERLQLLLVDDSKQSIVK